MIVAILVTHAVIGLFQFVVSRRIKLRFPGAYGIYVTLLPVGFNCFGVGLPPGIVAAMVFFGLSLLLWSVSRSFAGERVLTSRSS
jgi:hypothetical protein